MSALYFNSIVCLYSDAVVTFIFVDGGAASECGAVLRLLTSQYYCPPVQRRLHDQSELRSKLLRVTMASSTSSVLSRGGAIEKTTSANAQKEKCVNNSIIVYWIVLS